MSKHLLTLLHACSGSNRESVEPAMLEVSVARLCTMPNALCHDLHAYTVSILSLQGNHDSRVTLRRHFTHVLYAMPSGMFAVFMLVVPVAFLLQTQSIPHVVCTFMHHSVINNDA